MRACPLQAHWLEGTPITEVLTMAGILNRYRRFVVDGTPTISGSVAVGDSWACTNPSAGPGQRGPGQTPRSCVGLPATISTIPPRSRESPTYRAPGDPFYRNQISADRARIAEMDAARNRNGQTLRAADDPMSRFVAAAGTDPDLFRAMLAIVEYLEQPQDVLGRTDVAERLETSDPLSPPPLPGPARAQLLSLSPDNRTHHGRRRSRLDKSWAPSLWRRRHRSGSGAVTQRDPNDPFGGWCDGHHTSSLMAVYVQIQDLWAGGGFLMTVAAAELLTDEMLARFDERAPGYDRENRFFDEDWEELRSSGYLLATVPTEFGGSGLKLDEYTRHQRRLGYVAPPTALAVNMHCYWTGVAADLLRAGDDSCRFLLDRAASGEVLCALHGEAGNDMPLLLAVANAERVEGGWQISGHKIFGSLTPVWTLGGFHAMDTSDPQSPKVVHGFVPRGAAGIQIIDTWDTLGMRATQSQDTVLDKVFVPDELVAVVCPPGFGGAGPFHLCIFAWALMGFAATYLGAARRAFDIVVDQLPRRTSIALTHSMAHHPEVQHHIAEMRIALDAADALFERTCTDWAAGVDHPDWPVRLVGTRYFVISKAFDIVDRALDLTGGSGAFKHSRLEQIFRDVRMGRFHPGNTLLAHEIVGKLSLGLDPDDPQRWG